MPNVDVILLFAATLTFGVSNLEHFILLAFILALKFCCRVANIDLQFNVRLTL